VTWCQQPGTTTLANLAIEWISLAGGPDVSPNLGISYPVTEIYKTIVIDHGKIAALGQPDVCPTQAATRGAMAALDLGGARVRDMNADLVRHHVAITSTLAAFDGSRPPLETRFLDAVSPEAAISYYLGIS